MNGKEKMLELIKKKQGGGRSKKMETPKNNRKNMRKGPKIFNKQTVISKKLPPINEMGGNSFVKVFLAKQIGCSFASKFVTLNGR